MAPLGQGNHSTDNFDGTFTNWVEKFRTIRGGVYTGTVSSRPKFPVVLVSKNELRAYGAEFKRNMSQQEQQRRAEEREEQRKAKKAKERSEIEESDRVAKLFKAPMETLLEETTNLRDRKRKLQSELIEVDELLDHMRRSLMTLTALFEAIGNFGLPVALAGFLVWYLTRMNSRLLEQLSGLRELVNEHTKQHQDNLLNQCEKLMELVQERERQSQELVKMLVQSQLQEELPGEESSDE